MKSLLPSKLISTAQHPSHIVWPAIRLFPLLTVWRAFADHEDVALSTHADASVRLLAALTVWQLGVVTCICRPRGPGVVDTFGDGRRVCGWRHGQLRQWTFTRCQHTTTSQQDHGPTIQVHHAVAGQDAYERVNAEGQQCLQNTFVSFVMNFIIKSMPKVSSTFITISAER